MRHTMWQPPVIAAFIVCLAVESMALVVIVKEYCFGEIGCILEDGDFYDPILRPANPPPFSRERIDVTYTVKSRQDLTGKEVKGLQTPKIKDTSISSTRQTKILINGFLDKGGDTWYTDMGEALLDFDDFNVIMVDWGRGSRTDYLQAAVNARVVGLEIAFLIKWLKENLNFNPADFHIIGHSLGAHIAGYAGEITPGLYRISGLDPAEPYFQNLPPKVRLDPSDAFFVDVIHTDSDSIFLLGFGTAQASGHLDFYPNDGRRQPGCQNPVTAFFEGLGQGFDYVKGLSPKQQISVTCSHSRSHQLFIDSITSTICTYEAFNCQSYDELLQGTCRTCGTDGTLCARMGINADTWPGVGKPGKENIKMYLKTGEGPQDYCL